MEPASKRRRSASTAWEGVAAESMFQLFRELEQQVKAPGPSCATPIADVTNCRTFNEEQERFLKHLQGNCASFDPAVDTSALEVWRDHIEWIDVSRLHFTRPTIAERFLHGPHKGELVSDLKRQLRTGKVQSKDIIPLVVMKWEQRYWVIRGNRRLKALKDYVPSTLSISVRCVVHEPCAVSASVVATFLRMWGSTRNSELPDFELAVDTAVRTAHAQLSLSEPVADRLSDHRLSEGGDLSLEPFPKIQQIQVAKLSLENEDWHPPACIPKSDELHIRYHVERLGEYGRELLEFEVRPDGLLRYASNSCFKKVQKQCYVSQMMLAQLERIVVDSCFLSPNVEGWPPSSETDRQQLEISQGSSNFAVSTRGVKTPLDASGFEGMLAFFYLTADLEAFVFSVVRLHFGRDAMSQ